MISSRASEEPERARFTRYKIVSESEGPQASAVLPRWGKTNVPAKNKPRQDPLKFIYATIRRPKRYLPIL